MSATKLFVLTTVLFCVIYAENEPRFVSQSTNCSAVMGRDASLVCVVENLNKYKVAWLREDTQTILTIGYHVITKNHRVSVGRGDPQTWALTLRNARPADSGRYMCQVNTEPMITQTYYLQVFESPDIVDSNSSGEVMVNEGENASLHCLASGYPYPTIVWRREDLAPITILNNTVSKWSGEWLNITAAGREASGAYLCIASNGVPPTVSKRILLHVLCKPLVRASQKMMGSFIGETVTLQCSVEGNPRPLVYWTRIEGPRLENGLKYQVNITSQKHYQHIAMLTVTNVSRDDVGTYQCHAKSTLGGANADVTLYTLATTTITTPTTTTRELETTTTTTDDPSTEMMKIEPHGNKGPGDEDSFVVILGQHQIQSFDLSPSS